MSKKTVLDKIIPIGTIQKRSQQKKEIEEMVTESKNAIERMQNLTMDPDYYDLKENQEITILVHGEKKKVEPLIKLFIEWINNELADSRIIIKDIQEDLYDGHVLQMLIEKLTDTKISESKLNLSESAQKQNLSKILDFVNSQLINLNNNANGSKQSSVSDPKWSVESIYNKDLIAILHLLVAMAKLLKAPIRLPDNVSVNVIAVKKGKTLEKRTITEQITENEEINANRERDAFDTLFEYAPEKLALVENSLLQFINKHLNKIKMEITDLHKQMHDGVCLILLMGLLENYYVPEYSYHPNPTSHEEKLENLNFSFELIEDALSIELTNCRPEDIVKMDLKSTLRVLYNLFTKYKDRD